MKLQDVLNRPWRGSTELNQFSLGGMACRWDDMSLWIDWKSRTSQEVPWTARTNARHQIPNWCHRPRKISESKCCVSSMELCLMEIIPEFHLIPSVRPVSVNISDKPKILITETEYNMTCLVDGSVPETDIKWTQNNRPFKRGTVSLHWRHARLLKYIYFFNLHPLCECLF